MSAGQVSLFGELDGLFAPEMLPCTPPEQVVLLPGDHVDAMRADLAEIEHAETLAPDADPDQAWANAFGPAADII